MSTEVPVFVPTRGEHLGAVVTIPEGHSDLGVLVMSGRARDRVHRNGMWVQTAEAVAAAGAYTMRLDYPGVGNSTGEPAVFPLEDTPWWAVVDAATFLMERTPVRRILLVGTCFGARVMLDAAPHLPACVGLGFVCGPVFARTPTFTWRVRTKLKRLARRAPEEVKTLKSQQQRREGAMPLERRVSPTFRKALTTSLDRVRVSFLFGEKDFAYDELRFALDTMRPAKDRYDLDVVPGVLHTFQSLESQELIVRWVADLAARTMEPARV